eukprot:gene9339-biopygen3117
MGRFLPRYGLYRCDLLRTRAGDSQPCPVESHRSHGGCGWRNASTGAKAGRVKPLRHFACSIAELDQASALIDSDHFRRIPRNQHPSIAGDEA